MNFKTFILIAGALAVASAQQETEQSINMVEESPEQLAEAACHPGPARCARCRGAAAKRARRWRQIVAWRNNYQRNLNRWYHNMMRHRNKQYRYWAGPYYHWILKNYRAKVAYKNRIVASWVRTMNWRYNNCR